MFSSLQIELVGGQNTKRANWSHTQPARAPGGASTPRLCRDHLARSPRHPREAVRIPGVTTCLMRRLCEWWVRRHGPSPALNRPALPHWPFAEKREEEKEMLSSISSD